MLLKNFGFLADGVGPGWAQRVAASDVGMHYSLRSNVYVNLDSCFAENCWFPGGWCGPRMGAENCGVLSGFTLCAWPQHGDKFRQIFC